MSTSQIKVSKEDLRVVFTEKLKEKRLGRLAPSARAHKIDTLELKLKELELELENDNIQKRDKIKHKIDFLKRINDIKVNKVDNFDKLNK
jgi:hypothetical protein